MINTQQTKILLDAAKNAQLLSLTLLIEEILDTAVRTQIIHVGPDEAFRLAAGNVHIKILELLVKLTPDQVKQKEMVCTKHEEILKNVTHKPIIQFVFSLVPEKWEMIKKGYLSYSSSKILENSTEFIKKLTNVCIEFPDMAISTIFSIKAFVQKIYNFILSSKTIIMLFSELAMNNILCILDNTTDGLLDHDRRCVLKAMTTISNNNESKLEVRFVDKILREKFPAKKKSSHYSIE